MEEFILGCYLTEEGEKSSLGSIHGERMQNARLHVGKRREQTGIGRDWERKEVEIEVEDNMDRQCEET